MSKPLSSIEEAQYAAIIDNILRNSDLETVTRKRIRSDLEDALGGKDLSSQKAAIKALIEARFDAFTQAASDDEADIKDEKEPDDSKREPSLDADAKYAAELQAQENRLSRARATRGSSNGTKSGKIIKKKAMPRKKSAKKVGDDEDDLDATPKRNTGFQKPFNLSHQLAELVGETQLSRPQVVKKIWEHIKSKELQDPNDKRQIICDDRMQAVFKQASINMFQMNKNLGNHLYPVEEE